MNLKRAFFFIGAFFIIFVTMGQNSGFSGSVTAEGYYSGVDPMPFWNYANKRGRITKDTDFLGLIQGQYLKEFYNEDYLKVKGGLLYRDDAPNDIFIDEAYLEYGNPWFRISVGKRHRPKLYGGVSASNESILWSLNAPALPGLELETNDTYYFNPGGKFGFEAMWADYFLGKERHVQKAKVHRKYFRLVYRTDSNWKFKLGLQHFAQWGGISPERGAQPESFNDYIRIVLGKGGGEDAVGADQESRLGNHLGSWELYGEKELIDSRIGFIVNTIFEDGSGSRLANFPDGRYGLYWETIEKDSFVNRVLYEFYYTRHQSHDVNVWGADDYLNHKLVYNSGWTYQNRILGSPFFLFDKETEEVYNNKFSAHHIGISGQYSTYWHTYPYKFMMSYSHNEGTHRNGIQPNKDIWGVYAEGRILPAPVEINLRLLAEYSNLAKPAYAAGIVLKKEF